MVEPRDVSSESLASLAGRAADAWTFLDAETRGRIREIAPGLYDELGQLATFVYVDRAHSSRTR